MNDSPNVYSSGLRHLHWAVAALTFFVFVLGLTIDAFPKSWDPALVAIHMDAGLFVLALMLIRIMYRTTTAVPRSLNESAGLQLLEKLGHAALYLLVIIVCILGVAYSVKRGRAFDFGLFSVGPFMPVDRSGSRWIREVHEWAAFGLVGLVIAHAGMAIWHHAVKRDGALRRMLPGVR